MPAYSFKKRFIEPIRVGLGLSPVKPKIMDDPDSSCGYSLEAKILPKRQTIRAIGKRRHARPGEVVQLYCAMRTKQCVKIGEGRCANVRPIRLDFFDGEYRIPQVSIGNEISIDEHDGGLDDFARLDGFSDWNEMSKFWAEEHGDSVFEGLLIEWEPL